jgi:hypothetical protein
VRLALVDSEGIAKTPNVSKWFGLYHHLSKVSGAYSVIKKTLLLR